MARAETRPFDEEEHRRDMAKRVVLHPFLFAVYPILFFFSHNIDQLLVRDMRWPLLATLAVTSTVWLLLGRLISKRARRGLVLSTVLFFFFSYGHIYNVLERVHVLGVDVGHHRFLLPVWTVLLSASVYVGLRVHIQLSTVTLVLNVIACAFVFYSATTLVFPSITRSRTRHPQWAPQLDGLDPGMISGTKRDIYYIVLDRYGSARTLQEQYDYDNGTFLDYLTGLGFFVATGSSANYPKTTQSLASTINLTYLDEVAAVQGSNSEDETPLYEMMQDHAVQRFFKSRGYRYFHFGSWWPPTRINRYADVNVNGVGLSQTFMLLYATTILYPVTSKLGILSERLDNRRAQHTRVLHKFEQLATLPDADGPVFAFVHMLVPHDPYVFDRDGRFLPESEARERSRTEKFIAQLEFTNRKLQELVASLLSRYDTKPIIILQGDEGPFPERYILEGGAWWNEATRGELAHKFGILNAYYLPDGGSEMLYPSITPVNSFRAVLNFYFGADLPLLADRSYAISDDEHPYSFIEVTDSLRTDGKAAGERREPD